MPINLGDLNKKNKERENEEFKNQFRQLDGLYISNDSYENTAKRLRQMTDEKDRKAREQAQYEYERDNASFFDRFLNTLADVGTDLGEGFLGTLEGMADWGTYRLADLSDLIGQEQWAKDLRGNADFNSTGALFGKNENVQENLFDKGWTESIEKYSYSPELVDTIFQGVGNIGALAATTAVTGGGNLATLGASYTSAYGNARSEAKRNGASDRDANRAGIINGIAEALSEQFFEGMPGLSVEGWGGKFTGKMADKVQKYFGTTAGKIALKTLDAAGEGTEEIISNALVAVGNDLMHYYDSNYTYGMENQSGDLLQDFLDQWTNSDSWNQFLSASLTSAFLGSAKAVIDTGTQNKIINAYAKDNSMSFKDAKYILTGQLESAKQELQRDKAEYDSNVELEDMAKKRVLNYMQNTTGANIESQIDQKIREEEQNLGTKFTDEQREKMRTEIRSMYEDRINSQNRYQEFTLEKEPTDEREKGLYESFKKNNRNNTKETHEIYKFIKTLQDNNPTSKYRLTSNEELAKMGELQKVEQDGKVKYLKDGKEVSINGFKKGDTIYINADAVNPYQATIGHEIGEAIKASDKQAYDSLKQLVKQVYGEGNLDDYKQIYGENLTDNVEDEYVNDKLGEMFKDNKLIDRISGDRNLLQRFIDEVKRLLQYVTSKGEKKQLLKLQKSLQDKYIELYKEADFTIGKEQAAYSLTQDDTGKELSKEQQEYFKDSKVRDKDGRLLEVYHGTPNAGFTIYDNTRLGETTGAEDTSLGFHLTDNEQLASFFSGIVGDEAYNEAKQEINAKYDINEDTIIPFAEQAQINQEISALAEEKAKQKGEVKHQYINITKPLSVFADYGIDESQLARDLVYAATGEEDITNVSDYYESNEDMLLAIQQNFDDELAQLKDELSKPESIERIKEMGYDGLIFPMTSKDQATIKGTGNEYVVFNSNQIKNIDNLSPTEDSDIRYQLTQTQNQQTGFEGTQTIKDYTDYIDSLNTYNLPTNVDIEDEESYGVLTKEDYKNKKKELYENYVDRAASKIDEQVKEVARRNLELKSKDIADLKAITDKYSGMSREDIYNSDAKQDLRNFVEDHSHQEYEEQMINDEIQSLQKDIRSREFIISNEYKGEFPDGITQFKKNNPGIKIKFGQKGNLDTQLQELAELYPGQVNADVSYGDIPYVLADIMKQNAKTTKMQEFNLTEKEIDDITNKMFYGLTNNAISEKDLDRFVTTIQDKIRNKYARQMAIKEYRQQAKDLLNKIGLENIKDKKRGLLYQINTMKRNLRDIMSQENAQEMYDTYFKPISLHNAQIETDISDYNSRIQKYNLNNAESTYTQMLGELKYNPETSLTEAQVNDYLAKNKNRIDTTKVNSAIKEFRGIYDELLGRINEALEANGYKPIDYRKGYFPHFIEDKAGSILGKFAEKLGWQVQKGQLPTDIAGITEEFQPGKVWTSFSQQRTGDTTDYNALKGMDNYLRGAMDVIYHTQDIQRLRALEAEIRYQYSEKGVQEKLDEIFNNQDLSNEEKYAQAALIVDNQKNNPLGNFATELRNYTNNLANKKSISDRGMEQTMGRDMYSIMNNISGRVSANMVGANISSAMTNFIPITQAWSQVKTKNMLRGIYDTIKASIRDDGFTENSVYLTNRTQQADRLFKTKGQKATDVLGKPFEAIDSFTSNVIVRAKYYQNLEQGMNQVEAMDNADEFAKDVMAGRSKGDSPTMFNKKNPLSKLFTAFQLEVNNQYGYMFKDIKADLGKEAKDKIAMAFMKMFIGAWLYNAITEKITGRKAAFSPIDMAIDDAKIITNENMDLATKIQNLTKSAAQEAPFLGGVLGGGRLPIQGAIPYGDPLSMVLETGQNLGALMDDEKRDAAINSLKKEWLKPVYYVALPVAGGQIKKTNEGLAMYNHELPGSYTDSGKLRFEADTSPLGMLQAAVFGQYASGNAREYFDEGYSPLTEKQVNEAMDANLPIAEYREINKGITQAKKEAKKNGESQSEAQYDYIYNLPISMEQKNSLLNSKLGTSDNVVDDNGYVKYTDGSKVYWYDEDNDVVYNSKYREMDNIDIESLTKYNNKKDLTDYGNYGSLDEFNYATKNPTKYAITQQISSYDNYVKYKDDIAAIKDNYNDNTKEGQKKAQQEVFNYINSLPMNQYQKLMLQKMAGGYSIKNYEQAIFNYINNLDLTKEEKQNMHKELFG